jgi:branched-chain amino acid transport system ATP-binding protein
LLKVNELTVFYGDIQVLFNIGLQMTEKEFVSVVGANASGKSTLLRSISGLLRKTSGSIQFQKQLWEAAYEIVEAASSIPEGRRLSLAAFKNRIGAT